MTDGTPRDLDTMRPREVSAFAAAAAAGKIPVVPGAPPSLLPGTPADKAFNLFVLKTVLAAAGVVVSLDVVPRLGLPGVASALLVFVLGAAVIGLALHWLAFVGQRNFLELERGYTTLVLSYGMFVATADQRWYRTRFRVPWDYSGLWVLGNDGHVVTAPNPEVDPPGFYPSPNHRGKFELWTGVGWSGQLRDAA